MCDIVIVVGPQGILFGKNSDRDANEAQFLDWQPAATYPDGAMLNCTWVGIPQVRRTRPVLLSRPFWTWGAEMGANSSGVVIGNTAVFTRQPMAPTGLTGMDLVRLGLERADQAHKAVEVIVDLINAHGQGGGCGFEKPSFTYHNSFMVADGSEAYLLETAGKHWEVERITRSRTISNGLTIPSFAAKHSDVINTFGSSCRLRQRRTSRLARDVRGLADMIRLLQDHGEGREAPGYSIINGGLRAPCVHGGGLATGPQTTASWVAQLTPGGTSHWVTGTSAPCIGLFKPVDVNLPLELGPFPGRSPDSRSLWWRFERFQRAVMRNPGQLRPLFISERDETQAQWLDHPPTPAEAFQKADRLLERWAALVQRHKVKDIRPFWVRRFWEIRNRAVGWDVELA